jgi:hypothetical protein
MTTDEETIELAIKTGKVKITKCKPGESSGAPGTKMMSRKRTAKERRHIAVCMGKRATKRDIL